LQQKQQTELAAYYLKFVLDYFCPCASFTSVLLKC
jgi:hypothetical protein